MTGTLGAAAAAVAAWLDDEEPDADARTAFVRPAPRTAEAIWLRERSVPASMVDLSDGIAGDAGHLAAANGVRVVIHASSLPIAGPAAARDGIRLAATGGEDYELCFTAAAGAVATIREDFVARFGVPLTRVGRVEEGTGAVVVDDDGSPMELVAFQHWGEGR